MSNESTTKLIVSQSLIAAIYIAITAITYPISFLTIQFRVAEILLVLCFFNKRNVIGVTLGCVLINIASEMGPIDALFGGLATLVSALIISYSKHLGISLLLAIAINAFTVGGELYFVLHEPFWVATGMVAVGESTVFIVGYIIALILKHKPNVLKALNARQNLDFKW